MTSLPFLAGCATGAFYILSGLLLAYVMPARLERHWPTVFNSFGWFLAFLALWPLLWPALLLFSGSRR